MALTDQPMNTNQTAVTQTPTHQKKHSCHELPDMAQYVFVVYVGCRNQQPDHLQLFVCNHKYRHIWHRICVPAPKPHTLLARKPTFTPKERTIVIAPTHEIARPHTAQITKCCGHRPICMDSQTWRKSQSSSISATETRPHRSTNNQREPNCTNTETLHTTPKTTIGTRKKT